MKRKSKSIFGGMIRATINVASNLKQVGDEMQAAYKRAAEFQAIDTYREDCQTQTVLGARFAREPLVIETPIMISGMSYGALSKEAKIALAKATDIVGTSINNGEGGLLPEERKYSYRQVVQIVHAKLGDHPLVVEVTQAVEDLARAGPGETVVREDTP